MKTLSIKIPFWPFYLIGVYAGVQHYTHHKCIALAAVCAVLALR